MAKAIDSLLEKYGESHQNGINKFIHWICVPSIMFSLLGLLYAIPFPVERGLFTNWAAVLLLAALVYYLRLSVPMFLGFVVIGGLMLYGIDAIYEIYELKDQLAVWHSFEFHSSRRTMTCRWF